MRGRICSTALEVKAFATTARERVCSGGSFKKTIQFESVRVSGSYRSRSGSDTWLSMMF